MMKRLTLEEFEDRSGEFDELVSRMPDVDAFCSSSTWIVPAHEAFTPENQPWIRECDYGFVALTEGFHERLGRYRQPLEASWCLACPFAGDDEVALARTFVEWCLYVDRGWDLLFLAGVLEGSPLFQALVEGLGRRCFVGLGPTTGRYIASLEGGLDGFMSRRSSKFRHNLRRSWRRAEEAGVQIDWIDPGAVDAEAARALYERALAVEARSWKGREGTGILEGPMQRFYRKMVPRLARKGMLRMLFATFGGEDVAYIFGGVFNGTYRGLQMSFDAEHRDMSLGNLVQYAMVQRLCQEGVGVYDLGSDLDYKRRWAEEIHETVALIVRPF